MPEAAVDDKRAGESPSDSSPEKNAPGQQPSSGDTERKAGNPSEPGAIPYSRFAEHRAQYRQLSEENEAERKARLEAEAERDRYKAIAESHGMDPENLDPATSQKLEIDATRRRTDQLEQKMDAKDKAAENAAMFEQQRQQLERTMATHSRLNEGEGHEERRALVEQAYYFRMLADIETDVPKFVEEQVTLFDRAVPASPADKLRGAPDDRTPVKTQSRDEAEDAELMKQPYHIRLKKMMARARKKASSRMVEQDKRTAGL